MFVITITRSGNKRKISGKNQGLREIPGQFQALHVMPKWFREYM